MYVIGGDSKRLSGETATKVPSQVSAVSIKTFYYSIMAGVLRWSCKPSKMTGLRPAGNLPAILTLNPARKHVISHAKLDHVYPKNLMFDENRNKAEMVSSCSWTIETTASDYYF